MGLITKEHRVPFWGDENVLKFTVAMVAHISMNILNTTELQTLNV